MGGTSGAVGEGFPVGGASEEGEGLLLRGYGWKGEGLPGGGEGLPEWGAVVLDGFWQPS